MDEEMTYQPDFSHPYLEPEGGNKPRLKFLTGPLQEPVLELTQEKYRIGRGKGSDILIEDNAVSRVHAILSRKNSDFIIQDEGSRNGVYVNNLKMERAVLSSGDIVQIGPCVFQFVWEKSL